MKWSESGRANLSTWLWNSLFEKKKNERSTETEKPFFLCVCVCVFELDLAAGDLIIAMPQLAMQIGRRGTLPHCRTAPLVPP